MNQGLNIMGTDAMMHKANAQANVPMNRAQTTGSATTNAYLRLLMRLLFGLFILAALPLATVAHAAKTTPALPDALMRTPGVTATLLPNGQWLLLGAEPLGSPQAEARLYDPTKGQVLILETGLARPRTHHTASLLADGRVLIRAASAPGVRQ